MTTQEKIEVMKAYAEGKKIQSKPRGYGDWDECYEPTWNWLEYIYRIKPEPTYRPYKNTEEMIEDFKKRFNVEVPAYAMPMIWVGYRGLEDRRLITGFRGKNVEITTPVWDMSDLFKYCTYLDGSPCGMKEE